MTEIEKYARAAASTARTPPNSPARRAALEAENAARVAAEQFVKGLGAERDLIAAALAEARREGAEAMQAGAFDACVAQADADRRFAKSERNAGAVDCATELAEIIRALPLPTGERKDEPLVCDVCGAECADPWHYSSETTRHMHACDACWPGVRKQGGERQAVLLTDAEVRQIGAPSVNARRQQAGTDEVKAGR